jgi:ATP-dependent RNA helicase DDX52/ROK1
MHSNRSAAQREEVMQRFRRGEIWVLICTDLMARGIDFQGVQMVINYDLPNTAVNYIHRIGRTGRAGRKGEAVTFFTEDDIARLRPIANVVKLSGCPVPDWMLAIKPVSHCIFDGLTLFC